MKSWTMETAQKFINVAYVLAVIAAFLSINYDQALGLIYLTFIVGFSLYALINKNIALPIYRKGGWLKEIAIGIGAAVIFTIVSTLFVQLFLVSGSSIGTFLKIYGASIPAFQNSGIFKVIAFAIFIPIIETISFLVLFEALGDGMRSDFKWSTGSTWLALLISSGAFLFFHFTAKMGAWLSLIIVGLMMAFTIAIALWRKEQRAAIIMHIALNLTAILSAFGMLKIFGVI